MFDEYWVLCIDKHGTRRYGELDSLQGEEDTPFPTREHCLKFVQSLVDNKLGLWDDCIFYVAHISKNGLIKFTEV